MVLHVRKCSHACSKQAQFSGDFMRQYGELMVFITIIPGSKLTLRHLEISILSNSSRPRKPRIMAEFYLVYWLLPIFFALVDCLHAVLRAHTAGSGAFF